MKTADRIKVFCELNHVREETPITGKACMSLIERYLNEMDKRSQPSDVSDEDIDAFYPVKSETKALSMDYIIRQEGKREGAKAMRDGQIKPTIGNEKKSKKWKNKNDVNVIPSGAINSMGGALRYK